MKIKANGISMNYQVKGRGSNLVLIHGAGDNLNMWYHQLPVFSKTYRVITYDIRGSGKTESPEGQYSISLFAQDAYELMKSIGVDSAYFLGYSLGGRIALELTINNPDMVKALILANSSVRLGPRPPEFLEQMQRNLELLDKGDIKTFAERMTIGAFSPNFRSRKPTEFAKYMKVKLQNKPESIARVMRSLDVPTPSPDLSKVKCPVLIIVGENDLLIGVEQGRKMQEAIAGSKLVILPVGHAGAIESPERFNSAVLEFLSELR